MVDNSVVRANPLFMFCLLKKDDALDTVYFFADIIITEAVVIMKLRHCFKTIAIICHYSLFVLKSGFEFFIGERFHIIPVYRLR